MSFLKIVATTVLSATVISLGIFGLQTLENAKKRNSTEREIRRILSAIKTCTASGYEQSLQIEIFHNVFLVENRILVENLVWGEIETKFSREVHLQPGRYLLRIGLESSGLIVEWRKQ